MSQGCNKGTDLVFEPRLSALWHYPDTPLSMAGRKQGLDTALWLSGAFWGLPPSLRRVETAGWGPLRPSLRGWANTTDTSIMLKRNHLIGTFVLSILESLLKKRKGKGQHFVHSPGEFREDGTAWESCSLLLTGEFLSP